MAKIKQKRNEAPSLFAYLLGFAAFQVVAVVVLLLAIVIFTKSIYLNS